jgi:AraC-like DNA-binding protein
MDQHRGEIVEIAVRKSPFSIKTLAQRLGLSRNTLYSRFKEHDLSYSFIVQIGDLIHHDFKVNFPELKTTVTIQPAQQQHRIRQIERKYLNLLEHYEKLLGFLIKITHEHGLEASQKEVEKLVTEQHLL